MSVTRTTCAYCGVGCGMLVDEAGKISGDPDHPANFGRLCPKGASLGDTLGLEERLLSPKIAGQPANWDQALDLVAQKFSDALRDHGPDSVGFYVSGQMLTEDYYIANKLMKGFFGSANIDTNSRLCMASSVVGHKRAFGSDTVPGTYEDLELADVIVLTGSNLAWCHPVLFQRIKAAKAARPDLKIITIDPRRSATAKDSDLHLPIRADGDAALFNGLLAEIAARGAVNQSYVDAHVNGFDAALSAAQNTDAAGSGLSATQLKQFYDLWIGAEKTVTIYSQGVNQSSGGSDKVNAILNCHLATGRIGRAGMGPFSVTGQPNAMGGREVGGLANMLACHLDIENPAHRDVVQDHWNAPTICTQPGLKAVELFEACASGQIKALWIIGTNPAVSMPDAGRVTAAIKNVAFTVTSEVVRGTDTSRLVDVQLPATAWGEKTGIVTNSERRLSLQKAFLPAPGEARHDWQILCEVATRMGFAKAFSYSGPAAIFREYAALSGRAAALGRDFDISGLEDISDAAYLNFQPQSWPIGKSARKNTRFFAAGGFYHPGGKAKMLAITPPAPQIQTPGIFHLNSGRNRDQWHTMTRSALAPRLNRHLAEPYVEIHPKDANALGLSPADLVDLSNDRGRAILRVLISADVQQGAVFAPMHWSAANASAARINEMVAPDVDPFSGQPALKSGQVRLGRFKAGWYGFGASTAKMQPFGDYSATLKSESGWRGEFAGLNMPGHVQNLARRLLNLPGGQLVTLSDPAKSLTRLAFYEGEILHGLFFASPTPVALDRAHIIRLIGQKIPALTALAGRPVGDRPDPGPIVCTCFNLGQNQLRQAISEGAMDVVSLGKATAAGTNCGACKPALQAMITTAKLLKATQ